jgi:hypothetical protein
MKALYKFAIISEVVTDLVPLKLSDKSPEKECAKTEVSTELKALPLF